MRRGFESYNRPVSSSRPFVNFFDGWGSVGQSFTVKLDFIMDFLGQNLLSPASVFTWLYTGYTEGRSRKEKKEQKISVEKKEVKNCLKKKDRIKSWGKKRVFQWIRVAAEPIFVRFEEPRNWLQGIDSANLCSLSDRYAKYGCLTGPLGYIGWRNRFLGQVGFLCTLGVGLHSAMYPCSTLGKGISQIQRRKKVFRK